MSINFPLTRLENRQLTSGHNITIYYRVRRDDTDFLQRADEIVQQIILKPVKVSPVLEK